MLICFNHLEFVLTFIIGAMTNFDSYNYISSCTNPLVNVDRM